MQSDVTKGLAAKKLDRWFGKMLNKMEIGTVTSNLAMMIGYFKNTVYILDSCEVNGTVEASAVRSTTPEYIRLRPLFWTDAKGAPVSESYQRGVLFHELTHLSFHSKDYGAYFTMTSLDPKNPVVLTNNGEPSGTPVKLKTAELLTHADTYAGLYMQFYSGT
jgi:hypothetical protein